MIFDADTWQETWQTLGRHKLRTALTAFGIFWGIFMLVCLLGAGNGLRNGTEANFSSTKNSVHLWSGRPTSIPYRGLSKGRQIALRDSDLERLLEQFPEIRSIAPNNGIGERFASHEKKGESFEVRGITPIEIETRGFKLLQGRFINQLDTDNFRKTAVIGERVQEVLFGEQNNPIGKSIKFSGVSVMVVGVIAPGALNDWAARDSSKIYLPNSTLRRAFNQQDRIHSMVVTPHNGINTAALETKIKAALYEHHKVHPSDYGVIGSYNAQLNWRRVQSMFSSVKMFSWVVAIGTILAGVVGVGNIMLISVKERTREIGLRKALGATPASIIYSILKESVVLTFIAGYLGLVAGVFSLALASKIVAQRAGGNSTFMDPGVSFGTAFTAILVLLIAGILTSYLPAKRAAKIDPVVALQDE